MLSREKQHLEVMALQSPNGGPIMLMIGVDTEQGLNLLKDILSEKHLREVAMRQADRLSDVPEFNDFGRDLGTTLMLAKLSSKVKSLSLGSRQGPPSRDAFSDDPMANLLHMAHMSPDARLEHSVELLKRMKADGRVPPWLKDIVDLAIEEGSAKLMERRSSIARDART